MAPEDCELVEAHPTPTIPDSSPCPYALRSRAHKLSHAVPPLSAAPEDCEMVEAHPTPSIPDTNPCPYALRSRTHKLSHPPPPASVGGRRRKGRKAAVKGSLGVRATLARRAPRRAAVVRPAPRGRDGDDLNWDKVIGEVSICPIVKMQILDTCTAYGMVGAEEARMRLYGARKVQRIRNRKQRRALRRKVRQLRFSVRYVVDHLTADEVEQATVVANFLQLIGTVVSRHYPEKGDIPDLDFEEIRHYQLKSWESLEGENRIAQAEESLLTDGPIFGLFKYTSQWDKLRKDEIFTGRGEPEFIGGELAPTANYVYHAVVVTGFNERGNDGYFRAQNSAGRQWGDNGFGKIRKDLMVYFVIPHIPDDVV